METTRPTPNHPSDRPTLLVESGRRPTAARPRGSHWARTVLRVDAALCALVGMVFIVAAPPLAELVDALSHGNATTVVRGLGVLLVALAVDLALASKLPARHLPLALIVFGTANAAWVAATLVVVAAGWLSPLGIAVGLGSGAVVAGFAFEELCTAGAMRGAVVTSRIRIL